MSSGRGPRDETSVDPVRLETEHLTLLAPWPHAQAASVMAFVRRNRAHLGPWEPSRTASYYGLPYWEEQLALDAEAWEERRRVRFYLVPRADAAGATTVVGFVHFANIVRGAFQACHLGFGIDAAHQGRGWMHEALSAALEWAFEELRLHRIEANHRPENVRSGALLRRLGFVPQGYARDYLRIDGAWRDHVLTALTNPDWVVP